MWLQKEIKLSPRKRGFHLVTDEILRQLPELRKLDIGLLNVFIKHSSASLTINENADPTVRVDFESYFNNVVPENEPYYQHTYEGSDVRVIVPGYVVAIWTSGFPVNQLSYRHIIHIFSELVLKALIIQILSQFRCDTSRVAF